MTVTSLNLNLGKRGRKKNEDVFEKIFIISILLIHCIDEGDVHKFFYNVIIYAYNKGDIYF